MTDHRSAGEQVVIQWILSGVRTTEAATTTPGGVAEIRCWKQQRRSMGYRRPGRTAILCKSCEMPDASLSPLFLLLSPHFYRPSY